MSKMKIMLASVGLLAISGVANAQAQLDEIIITATERAESLQDVPIFVVAMPGDDIQELNLTNAADVTAFMPAVLPKQIRLDLLRLNLVMSGSSV